MSEWFKEAVLKTVELQGSGGSNPSLSGINREKIIYIQWRGARAVESGSLLRSCTHSGYRGFESHPLRFLCP